MNRRRFLLGVTAASFAPAQARAQTMSRVTAYAFTFKGLEGPEILLSAYAGRPILVVNTASQCGYTPQFAGLQELWGRYKGKGLIVLGVPSNDFGGQEPGGVKEIHATAQGEFHVTFPLTEKVAVKGGNTHPFYRWAAQERPADAPRWNFHKYLVGRDGRIRAAFGSATEPTDPRLIATIEQELAAD
jgi:glutathione peroxidase